MRLLIFSLLSLVFLSSVFAVPRFAMMEDVTCSSCHSYHGGGGLRNEYGREYASESLVRKTFTLPWTQKRNEFPVQFGADIRYQAVNRDEFRHFPMQFAIYSGFEINSLITHAEVSRISDEFRITGGIRYEGLPLDGWVFVGRELPTPGWRMDDHTTFIRGGNLNTLGLYYEGMPYTPYIVGPEMLQFGFMDPLGVEYSFSAGTAFIDPYRESADNFFMAKLNQTLYLGPLTTRYGISYLEEGELYSLTASYAFAFDRFVYLGEYVELQNWPRSEMVSVATLNQLSYRLFQGADLLVRYEFFDPDRKLTAGAISRLSAGLEFFPVSGVEVKVGAQQHRIQAWNGSKKNEVQFLGQLHIFI